MATIGPYHTTLPHVTKENWRDLAAQKREQQAQLIPAEWRLSPEIISQAGDDVTGIAEQSGILSARELEITELDEVNELAERIANKTYTAEEVAVAFSKRAAIAQQLTNCEFSFPYRSIYHALTPTQYGVPVSLKDQFDIAGTELTQGYVAYLGRISERDSALAALLRDSGAVFHCRTNVPQTLMIGETFNHLFGRTVNPHCRKLIPGGSSGGEGALIAMKGSILGVGTDIGGSVRIPSAMCGLHTIRPTTRRVPYGHATNSMLGQESIVSVAGPMARSLNSCTYFLRSVLNKNPADYDATSLPFAFNETAYGRASHDGKLSFGVMRTDHLVTPTPPIRRALEMAVQRVRDAGHEVIEFDTKDFNEYYTLAGKFFSADGGEDIRRVLAAIDEPPIEGVLVAEDEKVPSVYALWQLNRAREAMQQKFLDKWLATAKETSTGRPIDGLLAPPAPITACLPGNNRHVGYTTFFNLLDLPALVFPVTKVNAEKDVADSDFKALSEEDEKFRGDYDPQLTANVPVAVQLVGRRWRDEELLGLGEIVSDLCGSKNWKQQ
ncbi:amidase [Rhodotorula sp. JG-1b]|nr:amidase [Rhodotorula sp. JG-1b]